MQKLTVYEGYDGRQFRNKEEATFAILTSIERRLNLLHVARNDFYEIPDTDKEGKTKFILGKRGDTGKTIYNWVSQMKDLIDDLTELQTIK